MSNFESSLSDDESDESQTETKRIRYTYSSRRNEKPISKSRRRPSIRETARPIKASTMHGVILDNGAYSIKVNYSHEPAPKVIPNCIMKAKSERKRLFIGSQIDECRDCSGLYYLIPTERGYITKWDVQKPIWDHIFSKNGCPIDQQSVMMTQPLFNFKSIQDCIDEIFFEEYEVSAMFRANPTDLALVQHHRDIGARPPALIVDCGYSFSHVIPYLEGRKYMKGALRVNVGGKLLTNRLKDVISYRQYHVMEETYVINQVKEDTCFVSQDFKSDLKTAASSNTIVRNYVLPDFNNIRRGYIHDPSLKDEIAENCQILRLNNERFTVPEILFHPSDIGIRSIGLAEAIHNAIFACPKYYQQDLAKNIVCIGGCVNFPGFRERLESEVRTLLPATWALQVRRPEDPVGYSWQGGRELFRSGAAREKLVTRELYEELGAAAVQERFNDWQEVELHEDGKARRKAEIVPISYIDHVKKYDVFGKGLDEEKQEVDGGAVCEAGEGEGNEGNDGGLGEEEKSDEEKGAGDEKGKVKNVKKMIKTNSPMVYSVKILSTAKPNS